MKSAFFAAISAAVLAFSPIAQAAPVVWNFQGHFTDVSGYTDFSTGDQFQVQLSFDSAAAQIRNDPRRHELDPSSISMKYKFGSNPVAQLSYSANDGGLFFLRDNQVIPGNSNPNSSIDGLTFSLNRPNGTGDMTLIMRWFDTSVINGAQVPLLPPALTNMEANSFQGGDGNLAAFSGTIDHVSAVPEPETYAMLGAGLLGLAALARRKKVPNA